jgi:hypothetical protein
MINSQKKLIGDLRQYNMSKKFHLHPLSQLAFGFHNLLTTYFHLKLSHVI